MDRDATEGEMNRYILCGLDRTLDIVDGCLTEVERRDGTLESG